eukprot:TRINITY_DN1760_c0_g5_i4.p2 TRINITY_DN1760_c0_g5~~TRINITY_DN1760_c0_g5_i4.p2  ORF type:complete len:101 (+),score=13.21 TRINITY_DN1760_c0_g5_i4:135-437(+)
MPALKHPRSSHRWIQSVQKISTGKTKRKERKAKAKAKERRSDCTPRALPHVNWTLTPSVSEHFILTPAIFRISQAQANWISLSLLDKSQKMHKLTNSLPL